MEERHYAGVYWEDRKATKQECAPPILDMLARLRAHDPLLSRWYVMRATREESLASELTDATASATIEQGLGLVEEAMPQHGLKMDLWNGEADELSAKIELGIASYTNASFLPTPNSCILRMPRARSAIDALVRRPRMTLLLADLALAWNADWGIVSTNSYLMQGPPERPPHHPRVGWLTFLNGWRGSAPQVPKTHVTPVGTLGHVFATHDEQFTVNDGMATGNVRAMEDALARAKRLHPIGDSEPAAPTREPVARARAVRAVVAVGGERYGAALDAACAVDALASCMPARRVDLAEALLHASTSVVVSLAVGHDVQEDCAELRALLDLTERLVPDSGAEALGIAREALDRVR